MMISILGICLTLGYGISRDEKLRFVYRKGTYVITKRGGSLVTRDLIGKCGGFTLKMGPLTLILLCNVYILVIA